MLTHLAGIIIVEGDGSFTTRRPFWDGVRNHVALTRPLPMRAMSPSTVQSNIRMKPRKAAKSGHYMTSSTRPGILYVITRRLRGPGSDNSSLALTTAGILPPSSSSSLSSLSSSRYVVERYSPEDMERYTLVSNIIYSRVGHAQGAPLSTYDDEWSTSRSM